MPNMQVLYRYYVKDHMKAIMSLKFDRSQILANSDSNHSKTIDLKHLFHNVFTVISL